MGDNQYAVIIEDEDIHKKFLFTYRWKVHGFPDLYEVTEHDECHLSRPFTVGPNNDITFQTKLYVKGDAYNDTHYMSLSLNRLEQKFKKMYLVKASATVLRFDEEIDALEYSFESPKTLNYHTEEWFTLTPPLPLWNSALSTDSNVYLPNDVLTIVIKGFVESWSNESLPSVPSNNISQLNLTPSYGTAFWNMVADSLYSDVTLTVKSRKFQCHKAVLSSRSPVFSAMFDHYMTESRTNNVDIEDVEPEVFEQVLRFIYTDQCPKMRDMASKLMYPAEKYQLIGLKTLCEEEMKRSLTTSNAAEYLLIADKFNAVSIRNFILSFIKRKGKDVMATDGWKDLKTSSRSDLVAEIAEGIIMGPPGKAEDGKAYS